MTRDQTNTTIVTMNRRTYAYSKIFTLLSKIMILSNKLELKYEFQNLSNSKFNRLTIDRVFYIHITFNFKL